jgi:bifunctional non-homologous end joining protein LigD
MLALNRIGLGAAFAVPALTPRACRRAGFNACHMGSGKAGLDPADFTLRMVPGLLKRSKAWADYDNAARPLRTAIQHLAKVL